uniref:myb-related transcription factor, partner of profilin-like n=1 Tax=Scatophagus argus TaxID=75038 RepID=UPI001ED7D766|nr:myb-related transcription factor, partner of profilin-like [Scatophagus argus]
MPLQLTEGMSSRKRRPNWTDQECLLLAQLMQERKGIIRGKCSTGVSTQDKRQAWEEIAQAINTAFPHIQRTVSDCNKKWENLLAKSREEIKRQKRQAGAEGLSLERFSAVTQLVISVMNLADVLQQDREDSSVSELVETQQSSCGEDGKDNTTEERLTDLDLPAYPDPSTSPANQKMTFTDVPKSLTVQFGTHRAAGCTASAARLDTPSSVSPPSVHCTTLQERMDLEMSVLRRQEAVLKLQEEYYMLKIKLMKKQMEEPKD